MSQWVSKSFRVGEWVSESISQSVCLSVCQWVSQLSQSISQSVSQSVIQSVSQSVNQTVSQSGRKEGRQAVSLRFSQSFCLLVKLYSVVRFQNSQFINQSSCSFVSQSVSLAITLLTIYTCFTIQRKHWLLFISLVQKLNWSVCQIVNRSFYWWVNLLVRVCLSVNHHAS